MRPIDLSTHDMRVVFFTSQGAEELLSKIQTEGWTVHDAIADSGVMWLFLTKEKTLQPPEGALGVTLSKRPPAR